ncbi:hypothetical protein ABZW10_14505 [Kitasatospora sp. NPDC004723]|uniref:hypothetical protein n=1 Tax=Kitasatospora sp. NPDC004723 TaxID=3154288 RepID=UPI0033B60572
MPEAGQLLVDVALPSQDVVSAVAGYRFVAQRGEVVPQPVKEADLQETYRRLLARLALRALDEAFSVTPARLVGTVRPQMGTSPQQTPPRGGSCARVWGAWW